MFSNNAELGIMEQAYMKLKSQSRFFSSSFLSPSPLTLCYDLCHWERGTQQVKRKGKLQIRIYNLHKLLAKNRSQIWTGKKRKKSSRWH